MAKNLRGKDLQLFEGMLTERDLQLENELLEVALGRLFDHDVAHLLAHRSDLGRLRVASLLDLIVLLLREPDARL